MGNATDFSRPSCALFALGLLAATPLSASECPGVQGIVFHNTAQLFSQARTLSSLPNPLLSSGILQISDDSFVWQICEPFDIRTVIDANGVSQSIEGGPMATIGPTAVQSAIQRINIADIFRGRFDKLKTNFAISVTPNSKQGEAWHVSLVPHAGAVASVIEKIDINGCQAIEQVKIAYRDGGHDEIKVGTLLPETTDAQCPTG